MRDDIVSIAKRWVGTPYQHQASCFGAGADCLGLVRGIWREVYGTEPISIPAYSADWSEPSKDQELLIGLQEIFEQVPIEKIQDGDVLLFRMRRGAAAKHLAILSARPAPWKIIHAYSGRGVVETPLSSVWVRRIAGVFRFPDRNY